MTKSVSLSIVLLLTCLFALIPALARGADNLTPDQKASIATRFAAEVKYNYAGYGKYAHNYDSICRAGLSGIVNTATDEEFGKKLLLFANSLHDGHTSVSWNAAVGMPPFLQKRIGDKVFVTEVLTEDYKKMGVRRGTELRAIDGVPVIEYGEANIVPYVCSSTSQWSAHYPFDSMNLTKGEWGSAVTFTFCNADGKKFEITDHRNTPWDVIRPDMSIRFDSLPGNIGLLKIPSFRDSYFNAQEFMDLYEQKILPTDGLIIDIRDNTGGNSQIAQFVAQLLAPDSIPQAPWQTPKYQAAYASWGQKWECESVDSPTLVPFYMQYAEVQKYGKPMILLVNSTTFSSAENFAVLFINGGLGKVMGTPTGGNTGNPIMIDLGWGYYGMIRTRNETLADGTEFIGIGIQPDITVEETESVIFGNDNVVAAALKELVQTEN